MWQRWVSTVGTRRRWARTLVASRKGEHENTVATVSQLRVWSHHKVLFAVTFLCSRGCDGGLPIQQACLPTNARARHISRNIQHIYIHIDPLHLLSFLPLFSRYMHIYLLLLEPYAGARASCRRRVVKITTPWMGIADTLDTIMHYGTGPTTVQVDYSVTRSLTMCRCYY